MLYVINLIKLIYRSDAALIADLIASKHEQICV